MRTVMVAPSEIAFLYDSCPRCSWRKVHGLQRPKEAMPKIFKTIDASMKLKVKDFYDAVGIPIKGTVSFEHVLGTPIVFEEYGVQLQIRGYVDKAVEMEDGTIRVCELKFADVDVNKYRGQVACYTRAIEHPAKGEGREVSACDFFFLQPLEDLIKVRNVDKDGRPVTESGPDQRMMFSFTGEVHHREVDVDRAWFDQKMDSIARIAAVESLPDAGEYCDYCATVKATIHCDATKVRT